MIRRPRRVGTAAVVALALLALCVAVIVSLAQRLSGAREFLSYDSVAARLHDTEWGDPVVLVVGTVVALIGLALVAVAATPGRAVVVPLRRMDSGDSGIERRSLRLALRRAAIVVPGVDSARIGLRGNVVRVSAASDRVSVQELPGAVHQAVTEALERVGIRTAPRVRTRLRPARTRGSK